MPRLARLDAPDVLHHVIIRGIERRIIFEDNKDRDCKEKVKSGARAHFCFWAVRGLGYGQRELARRLGMTQPGVGYAVIKGEEISHPNNYQIKD
jgi:hypothetical protein